MPGVVFTRGEFARELTIARGETPFEEVFGWSSVRVDRAFERGCGFANRARDAGRGCRGTRWGSCGESLIGTVGSAGRVFGHQLVVVCRALSETAQWR